MPEPEAGANSEHATGATFGPAVTAEVTFPKAGLYVLIGQLRRGDELILAPFYVDCGGGNATSGQGARN